MAIIKPFETPQGVSATYHKILKAELSMAVQALEITVAVYASAEARDSGKNVLWHAYQTIPFAALTQDPRDVLYPLLAKFNSSYLQDGAADAGVSAASASFEIGLLPEFTSAGG